MPKGSILRSTWSDLAEFQTRSNVMNVLVTCKYEDPIKNEGARVFTTFSPLYPYGSYRLPWTPEF